MSYDLILVIALLLVLFHIISKRLYDHLTYIKNLQDTIKDHLTYIKCLQDITKDQFNALQNLHNYTMEQSIRINTLEDHVGITKQEDTK